MSNQRFTTFLAACLLAGAAGAVSEDSTILSISTTGPDVYADGTTVLDGERYALVWRRGDQAVEFNADGTLANTHTEEIKLIYSDLRASGGRCPETRFVIDGSFRNSLGNYVVVLFDTRRFDGSGGVTVGSLPLNGYAPLVEAGVGFSDHFDTESPKANSFTSTLLPAELGVPENPVVTSLAIEDGEVVVSVTNTSSYVNYTLSTTDDLNSPFVEATETMPVTGATKTANTVTLRFTLPQGESNRFFRVIRKK